ncbi:MAG: replication-relaxation family protein [Oligoflexia bacterium]|nr:replication-relaxation family protein [Oligoflexia bacterium]
MSERKEEIFKESSTNKNSTCPNTSSSFNGELEGRRNLSNVSAVKPYQDKTVQKNKFYSAIGINQKLFKQKPLDNKKASVPNPTERDLLLLETLESYGVLSTQQVRELIFKGINTRTVLRRLRLLKQRGFIYSSEGLPNGALAWVLSKRSALLFKHNIETKIINKNTLQHDVAVSSIRIQLERLKITENWTSEHILKKEVIKSHYEEKRNSSSYMDEPPLVPDSLFITSHEGEMKAVALELELTLKSKDRYKKIFSQYKKKEKIWFVWYVVLTCSAGESLSKLWDKYAIWGDCQFAYSTLEEVFKYDFKLPEPRDEDLRETNKREEREKWL